MRSRMTYLIYLAAALAEIAGCFAFRAWLKLDRSPLWLVPGVLALCLFAWLLTLVEAEHAGRAYAAYGGIYILSTMGWLWVAEGVKPDRWDAIGVDVCLVGASIILWIPRTAREHSSSAQAVDDPAIPDALALAGARHLTEFVA